MKILNSTLCAILLITFFLTACKDDDAGGSSTPTAEEFQDLRQTALDNITQNFQFDPQNGSASFTSNQGVQLNINSNCLTSDGNPATGNVDVEFVEIFDRGTMLVTNKPTMGILPNGEQSILISGGELFINATQNGTALQTCNMTASIPGDLTGGLDYGMSIWAGNIDADDNLTWVIDSTSGIELDSFSYYVFTDSFGWINCDVFYDDSRPKTDISVEVPTDYDSENSGVFFSIVGESSGLGTLGGQFPIGLECHIIFVTAEGTNWRYAIQSVTIVENHVITFNLDDTAVVTEAELITIINDLP